MCYVIPHKPAMQFQVGNNIFNASYCTDFKLRSANFSVCGWDDGNRPGSESRPIIPNTQCFHEIVEIGEHTRTSRSGSVCLQCPKLGLRVKPGIPRLLS